MIQVQGLSKKYARHVAVNNISFSVEKGDIVGFLGPNGAGKTTTMRILTCFMPPTEGTATVSGFDVFEESFEVKKHIGYLPEAPPLYPEMTVSDYLNFVARLKNVPSSEIKSRTQQVMERCAVADESGKLISKLSKGYRQRVGLAQAIIHNPDVLILDEPTSGLDPKQINETRELIKSLAGEHTIILSTHILPEVEMTCSRVIIINRGRIEACDTPENLLNQMRTATGVILEAKTGTDNGVEELKKIAGVKDVSLTTEGDWQIFSLRAEAETEIRPEIFRLASERRWTVRELSQRKATLEDVFVEITHPEA